MPIDRIPILPEDYPLFDWNDYAMSYYALGEGELVSGFQKETWNAIIAKTQAALNAAGMSWDTKYTSAAAAKITKAYGPLSAKMFNSVRHNIDRPAPVGWGWANNPNLRGFVGREDFKGYADYGLDGDHFYAEYLLELVRRLNLLLSIMKGTANLSEMAAPVISQTEVVRNLLALPSAPLAFSEPAYSSFICGLMAKRAGQFSYKGKARSLDEVSLHRLRSKRLLIAQQAHSLQNSRMQMPRATNFLLFQDNTPSISQAEMDVFNAMYLSSGYGLSRTKANSAAAILTPKRIGVAVKSNTGTIATQQSLPPKPIRVMESAKAGSSAEIHAASVVRSAGTALSKSSREIIFEKIRPRRMHVESMAGVTCVAILDSAWLAPIWVNGKLYIRQAYETQRNDAALEVK